MPRQFYGRGCRVGTYELAFSSSRSLSLSRYILSLISMVSGSRVCGLTCMHLHLYPHTTDPADHCSFPYLVNFMAAAAGSVLTNPVVYCSFIYILHSKHL
jgi:hypothetical protein